MKSIYFILFSVYVFNLSAQITFEKAYDNDLDLRTFAVLQTSYGHYVLAGTIATTGSDLDVHLIKTDDHGDTVWTRTYPGYSTQFPTGIEEMADHSYLVSGWESTQIGPSRYSAYLMKIETGGDTVWTKTIGPADDSEQIFKIQPTADGGYLLCGYSDEKSYDNFYYLLKVNADGDSLWRVIYNPMPGDKAQARSVLETMDGDFVVAGTVDRDGAKIAHLVKLDSTGQVRWAKTWALDGNALLYDVKHTPDGGFILGGYTDASGAGGMDFLLIKTNSDGDSIWTRTYGGPFNEFGYCVEVIGSAGFVISGTTGSFGAGSTDFYLVRTNSQGDTLWTRTFGGRSQEWLQNMHLAADGGFILTGYSYSFGYGENSYLVKTDETGLVTFTGNIRNEIPRNLGLEQNYPNPFNPATTIRYQLPLNSDVELSIYNLLGQKVATLVGKKQPAGNYQVEWNAAEFSSGVYYYKLTTEKFQKVKEMILMK